MMARPVPGLCSWGLGTHTARYWPENGKSNHSPGAAHWAPSPTLGGLCKDPLWVTGLCSPGCPGVLTTPGVCSKMEPQERASQEPGCPTCTTRANGKQASGESGPKGCTLGAPGPSQAPSSPGSMHRMCPIQKALGTDPNCAHSFDSSVWGNTHDAQGSPLAGGSNMGATFARTSSPF